MNEVTQEEKIAVENAGGTIMYKAGRMIPPGEIRHFSRAELGLPPVAAAAPAEVADVADAAAAPDLEALIKETLKTLLPKLPGLPDAQLVALGEMEQRAEHPRSTLLAAIAELQLDRAAETVEPAEAAAG